MPAKFLISRLESGPKRMKAVRLAGGAVFVFLPAAIVAGAGFAASLTSSASVVIDGDTGSVGETETTATTDSTSTFAERDTEGGGSANADESVEAAGETTFRPVPEAPAPPPVGATPGGTTQSLATSSATRLPQNTQQVGNLLGGSGAVAVAGQPNQTFAVSLPGKTVYAGTSGGVVTIDGFVHNAGFTPALNTSGAGVFQMGAQLSQPGTTGGASTPVTSETGAQNVESESSSGAGTAQTPAAGNTSTAAPVGGQSAGGSGIGAYTGPVIAQSPFINITISYN